MIRIVFLFIFILISFALWVVFFKKDDLIAPQNFINSASSILETSAPTPSVARVTLQTPPERKILANDYHIFQSFNNCGPAALSMALSYYDILETQQKLGQDLRPYQVPGGDNDDKSVTLEELAEKSKEYGFIPYHRPNGNKELIQRFITYDIPIVTRTWLKENEDIGHYRVIKGYDQISGEIIQDDSLQGKNLRYTFDQFDRLWQKFNYEYLVLVPQEKKEIAEAILGEDVDQKTAWQNAVKNAKEQLLNNPSDIDARFNLSVAYYNIGEYQKSVDEFSRVESQLPFRTLWYQIEPIQAYYELGNYDKVFQIIDRILNNHNRAFSELYIIRGNIYLKQGEAQKAQSEFEKANIYNKNSALVKQALENAKPE